jgi:hypothetical protein
MPLPDDDGTSDLLIGSFRKADRAFRLDRWSDDLTQSLFACPRLSPPPRQTVQYDPCPLDRAHQTQDRETPCH